ncbi:MAG: SDR family oxidoreductase [Arenicellales bacterium]|jgi:NADP-dependent 3-hydroxy acid dehydrogenase YdfG|nr:oxidoreductase [Acidiferrobacteraceae bacterium]MDP6141743.1 SDR family oxidoreductase [Arenicellales bacterium]MDP7522928.1 SDR family oxidoreductase [Arenicellales bacterium]|tara:strand:- start:298 stop:1044 length:747 start_codon:yes stop_codon:yes gene_type:complete
MALKDYRTALVTGASSGIGAATVRLLAARGIAVHALARRRERLEALAGEGDITVHAVDIRDRSKIYQTLGAFDIDILVNSAGIGSRFDPFHELDPDNIDATLETNVLGTVHAVRAAVPGMVARGRGHIVNIGSIFGLHAIGTSVYGASKGAVHILSQDLRHDLKGTGIRVTEVSPGRTETEIFATMTDDLALQDAMAVGFSILTAEDVAEAVVWALDQPWRVNVSLIELTATEQIPGGVDIHPVAGSE